MPFAGAKAYNSAYVAWSDQEARPLDFDSTEYDTSGFHFTSAANLSGTVAKTASSPNLVGSGTAFLSELSVNQVISIPGTATEIGVVKAITDDTHLELWQTMANSASGQTARRRNEYMGIPAGLGGYYHVVGGTFINKTPYHDAPIAIISNHGTFLGASITPWVGQPDEVGGTGHAHGEGLLDPGDWVATKLYIDNGSAKTFYVGGAPSFSPTWNGSITAFMAIHRIGV